VVSGAEKVEGGRRLIILHKVTCNISSKKSPRKNHYFFTNWN